MDKPAEILTGRKIALLVSEGFAPNQLTMMTHALDAEGCIIELVGAHGGTVKDAKGKAQKVDRPLPNAPSVIYDGAVVLGGSSSALLSSAHLIHFLNEAFRHGKPLAFLGNAAEVLSATLLPTANPAIGLAAGAVAESAKSFVEALLKHRFPGRNGHLTKSKSIREY